MTQINAPLITRRQKLRDKLWEAKLTLLEEMADGVINDPDYVLHADKLWGIDIVLEKLQLKEEIGIVK